jgi:pre-mRNA-splicing factor CWC22
MVIECCSQERSYSTFYGLTSERFCKLNRVWCECYERAFETYYDTIHRYETNRLRNIARLFGHLLANDAMSWAVLQAIKMNEDDTTSSSRIFVKIMMQEVTESMGLPTLKERFADPEIKALCSGMFPLDNPKNTRFAINYFTSVGLGALTEEMREHLKVSSDHRTSYPMPKLTCATTERASSYHGATPCNVGGRIIVLR